MPRKTKTVQPEIIQHEISQEDLDANPGLEKDVAVGDIVEYPADEATLEKSTSDELSVYDKHGAFIRTYSLEIHGEDFMTLAETFAKKIGGSVR